MTPEQKDQAPGPLAEILKPRATLWDITSEIAELLELRESAESEEVKGAADQALEAYREKLPQKVDDTRGWIKHCQMMAECAIRESREQTERARIWNKKADHAKAYALETMLAFGTKKLSGRTGDLRVAASPSAVEVSQQDLVPIEYRTVTVRMPAKPWCLLLEFLKTFQEVVKMLAPALHLEWQFEAEYVVNKAALAAALKAPCEQCSGTGEITDLPEGETFVTDPCPDCAGSGKACVPGARLMQGSHLRL